MSESCGQQNYEEALGRFRDHGQERVFRFWDDLGGQQRQQLLDQASAVDLAALERAHEANSGCTGARPPKLETVPVVRLPAHGGDALAADRAFERGSQALADGRVAVLVVAGGQATRLGFDQPKGAYPVGPVSERSLFEQQAQKIRGLRRRYGRPLPWYIMTSDATDAATRALFAENDSFGLPAEDVIFFQQGMVQSLDFEGRMMLECPDRIFENPNGHGGSLTALLSSGSLDDMERRGIDTVFYYQVDNPLVKIGDPVYLGFHEEAGSEMSCKVARKRDPHEKVGVVARLDDSVGIIEYTELGDEQRFEQDAEGRLIYWAGNIAIHVLNTDFVRRVAEDATSRLPYHLSAKKIPTVSADGTPVQPEQPNGHKLERFVFDALAAAGGVSVLEVDPASEFSPIKNASGSNSPDSSRKDLTALYRQWLGESDIELPPGLETIEIDHSFIDGPEDAKAAGYRNLADAGDVIRVAPGMSS